jgi:CspA family cold shock protein
MGTKGKEMKNMSTGTLSSQVTDRRFIGRVEWFSERKGYGFIDWKEDKDVFVHRSAIQGQGHKVLHGGQRVEFGVKRTPKGPEATDVIKLPGGAERAVDHHTHNPQAKKRPKGSDSVRARTGLFVYSYTIQSR